MIRQLITLVPQSLPQPRQSLRQVLNIGFGVNELLLCAVAVVALGVLLMSVGDLLMPAIPQGMGPDPMAPLIENPLSLAVIQLVVMLGSAAILYAAGQVFSGNGGFGECLTATIWLQFLLLSLQVLQLVFLLIIPPFAVLLTVVTLVLVFYWMVNFVKEVHGFTHTGFVFLGVFIAVLISGFVTLGMLAVLGASPLQGLTNV